MKQLQVDTIKQCKCCKNKLPLFEMYGWTRSFNGYGSFGKPLTEDACVKKMRPKIKDRPSIPVFICKSCWPKSFEGQTYHLYKSLEGRELRNFNRPLTFSLEEFWVWLKKQGYTRMQKSASKKQQKGHYMDTRGLPPSIDRINSFDGYNLNNMQILPIGENVAKGNAPAIGAKLRTMRFFKLLRKQTGKTKYQMAKHLGMLPQTYFYLEDKARGCSFEILCLIKKKLDLDWNLLGAMIEDEVVITKKDKEKADKEAISSSK